MDSEEVFEKDHQNEELLNQNRTICLHTFSDLSYIPPLTFVYLLKECYLYGTRKATFKFRVLQHHVLQALSNAPEPGPATFVVRCLYILPLLGPLYTEGFSHLMLSSLRHLQVTDGLPVDSSKAKYLASRLLLDVLARYITHEERILVKLLEVFEIELKDIGEVICTLEENDGCLDIAKAHIEQYISEFIESGSYMTAVTLLEHFSIGHSGQFGHSLLVRMMEDNQFNAAEKLAALMGKPMICLLVQKYIDMKMLKNAFDIMNKNNLKQEFPDLYYLYKESSLKKFAEKGCWDVAEVRTNKDKQLLEYLVYLALEAGYTEKVHELCERYSLSGFTDLTVPEVRSPKARYLQLKELISDDIVWVEEIHGLLTATSYIEGCKVVGIDCEWKPTYEKGSQPNKVSIIQIASEKKVFIFDLIKLYLEESKALDDCFKRILCSPKIMKLGYNLQCDLRQLSHSYGDLECFRNYEMLLDIEKLFKECRGGLSALAKKILGAGLNKTRRNSNWEQRPLSQNQIEYAALDAAVLVHIFRYVCGQPPAGVKEEKSKIEWRSHIVSHMGCTRGACNS